MNVTRVLSRASDNAEFYVKIIPEFQNILRYWNAAEATPYNLENLGKVDRLLADTYTAQSVNRRRLVEAVVNFAVLVSHQGTAREREVRRLT